MQRRFGQVCFAPDNFPEIACTGVIATNKAPIEQGFFYELILILKNRGNFEIGKAIGAISKNKIVVNAKQNTEYAKRNPKFNLNYPSYFLKLGESIELNIAEIDIQEHSYRVKGISFSVDSSLFDTDPLQKDTFKKYGISRFWPETDRKDLILSDRPDELEAKKSETGKYYGLVDSQNTTFINAINSLAQDSSILSASILKEMLAGGNRLSENWEIGNPKIVNMSLSDGQQSSNATTLLNQTAIINGISTGVTTVSAIRSGYLSGEYTATCLIVVYLPGDINQDGLVTSLDALDVLRHCVGLEKLCLDDQRIADMDDNGVIDAFDALAMLQISVGKDE